MIARIPLMKQAFYDDLTTRTLLSEFVKNTDRFSMGKYCDSFEREFIGYQDCQHAVFVSSGSAANLVLLQALLNTGRLRRGDRVGFSALTWATNVMPIIQLGLIPVPFDCELSTLNVSRRSLEESEESIDALFLTNTLGFAHDLPAIADYCHDRHIILLEDNCESLGSKQNGVLLGNFGLASTFSFFIGHHLSTIEGGMICTDDQELHEMCVMVRAHGWDRNLSPERQQYWRDLNQVDPFYAQYTFYDLAFNARPTEIQGFLGSQQLPYLEETISIRQELFARSCAIFSAHPQTYICPRIDHMDRVSSFAISVVCRDAERCLRVRSAMDAVAEIRPIVAGDITSQPFYRKYAQVRQCPNTTQIHKLGFYFGNCPDYTAKEVDLLCDTLNNNG